MNLNRYARGATSEINKRKDAIGLCQNRRALTVPKIDTGVADNHTPASAEIDEALSARGVMKALLRHGDTSRLDPLEKKSLSPRRPAIIAELDWPAGELFDVADRHLTA